MATYPRPTECFHCGCFLVYSIQVHPMAGDLWRIDYACPGCQLGQFGPGTYYGEYYSQAEAEALLAEQNGLQETEAAREAVRSWRDEVQRRDTPPIQRFWELFDATFPYWKDKVQHLALTPEHTASMDKHLYCLMLTFYSRAPDGSLNWEIRAEVERWGIRLDPMHQHHDRDRDPHYVESALQEIKEHFEDEWSRSGDAGTLEAFLGSLVLQSYQSTSQGP
jgi:hypothetical protein